MVRRDGQRGAYWENHPERKTLNCNLGVVDLSEYDTVTLHLSSEVANDAPITFVVSSENPATEDGIDYYRVNFNVDWVGDRTLTYKFSEFHTSRTPIGWHHVDSVKFWSDFGGITPPSDTVLTIWSIEFTKSAND